MGGIGLLALLVNTLCFGILWRARDGNLNLRSAWLCSRNDMLANLAVLLAAGGVALTGQAWPDWVVGLAIVLLFSHTALHVSRAAWQTLAQ
jgi:Co/Zn/Cd efflux system component